MTDRDRDRFNAEIQRKADWLFHELSRRIAAGDADAGVLVCALMVTSTNIAQCHGIGPEVAAWLRSQLPALERMLPQTVN